MLYKLAVEQRPISQMRPSLNQFVRDYATTNRLALADLERMMEAAAPHGIQGSESFLDPCHLNWHGYYRVAACFVDTIGQGGLISSVRSEPLPAPSLDRLLMKYGWEHLCDLSKTRIINQ